MIPFVFLCLGLCVPLILSFAYGEEIRLVWLLESVGILTATGIAVLSIGSRIRVQWIAFVFSASVLLVYFTFEGLRAMSFYLQGEGFNERFFYYFNISDLVSVWRAFLIEITLVLGLVLIILTGCWFCISKRLFQSISLLIVIPIIILSFLWDTGLHGFAETYWPLQTKKNRNVYTLAELDLIGLNTEALNQESIDTSHQGKNLVLIYLESLEQIYLDNSVFLSLTPNINRILPDSYSFINMHQVTGANWTIGGIVASQCGTPLLYDLRDGNDLFQTGFLSNVECLSDVLRNAGYYQVYLGGARNEFGGKEMFLRMHNFDEILGFDELVPRVREGYYTSWGLYDDSLFDIASKEYSRLAENKSPFNLTLLTLDMHHPNGHKSMSCKPYTGIQNSMLDAVHCTDQLLNDFIQQISSHPAFNNTIVVLVSDHLAMRNVAQKRYPEQYDRKLLFAIIGNQIHGENMQPGTHMDIAPTVLDSLGVNHNVTFLAGESLFNVKRLWSMNLKNAEVQNAVKYVNRHFFSESFSLCDESDLLKVSVSGHDVRIGGIRKFLTYLGGVLSADRLKDDMALMAKLDQNGHIGAVHIFRTMKLLGMIMHNQGERYLLIAPDIDMLQKIFPEAISLDQHISDKSAFIILVQTSGYGALLGTYPDLSAIKLEIPGCEKMLTQASSSRSDKKSILKVYWNICKDSKNLFAHFNKETRRLYSPKVAYESGFVEATLIMEDGFRFVIDSYEKTESQSDLQGDCHGEFDGETLILPAVLSDEGILSIRMKFTGSPPEFRVKETYPQISEFGL